MKNTSDLYKTTTCFTLFPNDKFSILKDFVDDSLTFGVNGGNFSESLENTLGKGEIARFEQFLLFLQCFQKTRTADT